MPFYYFHVLINGELIEDTDGVELSEARSIRDHCLEALQQVISEEKWDAFPPSDSEFVVVDELGKTIAVIPIRA